CQYCTNVVLVISRISHLHFLRIIKGSAPQGSDFPSGWIKNMYYCAILSCKLIRIGSAVIW
ncbi:hypothetical protein DQQ96_22835, partial [Salmonella enterica subsp. enterica serovar Rissen]|nr:hypothetical protein [Salmonella enterica subsp. enterica serovar Rissen]EBW9620413.1 hypothetical protein [Salmonella enterica subsp. enterica serovar Rissen]